MKSESESKKLKPDDIASLKPADDDQLWQRGVFLATAIASLSSNTLSSYIRYCLQATGDAESFQLDDLLYQTATKEILTLNLWLCLAEDYDSDMPEWFNQFILSALTVADMLVSQPTNKQVLAMYPTEMGFQGMTQSLSLVLSHKLGLGSTRPEAALALGDLILECKERRQSLVLFALREAMMTLDVWVAEMKPA